MFFVYVYVFVAVIVVVAVVVDVDVVVIVVGIKWNANDAYASLTIPPPLMTQKGVPQHAFSYSFAIVS